MTPFIIRYKVLDHPNRPLGELHMSDRRLVAVWDRELHATCLELSKIPALPVIVKTRKSGGGHLYLTAIEAEGGQQAIYERARQADEQTPTLKRGGYIRRRISQGVEPHEPAPEVIHTQVETVPPVRVGDDHASLMKRIG